VYKRQARSLLDDSGYYDDFVPLAMDAPTIDVDTTTGYEPSIDQVVSFVGI